MDKETEEDFIRSWSARAHDEATLAAIEAIYEHLIKYALHAWRPMTISPPQGELLIAECVEGVALLRLTEAGDWRTNEGKPHKPPLRWMRAPLPAKPNGKEK